MNVFLTGATGFLGKTIVKKLISENHTITTLLMPGEPDSGLERARIVRGDITEPETLTSKMDGNDVIIHLAGSVGYGLRMKTCLRINKEGTYNVAREALRSGIHRFIHFSSVSVYGRISGVPITEDFPMKKIGDPYGDTKIDAECVLHEFAEDGLDLTIVRPTVIYGPGDDKFLPKLIENMRSGKARIVGDGGNSVDLIHVDDVADFTSIILRDERTIGRVYNLTNPVNPTWKEMLNIVASEMGIPAPEKHIPYSLAMVAAGIIEFISFFTRRPPRLTRYAVRVIGRQYYYSTERIQKELGFQPAIDLREGIRKCVREYIG
jgi:nucleoside-diphosphate-sugar epimerase